ncbi:MAG: hypothetical protein ABIQ95_16705 [Bdellovibrionia bacterium]
MIEFLTALVLNGANHALAAACCGKSSAAPFLMVGDDQMQLSLGLALGNVVAHIADDGVPNFGSSRNSETSQAYKLDMAALLSDRIQGGFSVPIATYAVSRGNLQEASTGLGDVRLSLGYEFLPSWSYSVWRPQGFLFTGLTLPTGRSYDGRRQVMATDVTGTGYFTWTVGALLLKKWTVWDVFLVPETHYSFSRTTQDLGGAYTLSPGFGGSIGVGFGLSPGSGNLRFGFRLQPKLEQGLEVSTPAAAGNLVMSAGAVIATCDTGIDASYMMSSVDSVSVSYTDQTLLGPAMNTSLSRSLGINFQHRWER